MHLASSLSINGNEDSEDSISSYESAQEYINNGKLLYVSTYVVCRGNL